MSDGQKLLKHAAIHFLAGISALALWAAADTWFLVTGLGLASFLSISTALVAGAVVSTLIHEWCHYLGARLSGSTYKITGQVGLFVYDFDFGKSTVRQFNIMSWSGQAGSYLAIVGLLLLVPIDNAGRAMLIASAVGSAIFGSSVEWPVIMRTRDSQNPLQELSKITPAVFNRGLMLGAGGGLLCWLAIS